LLGSTLAVGNFGRDYRGRVYDDIALTAETNLPDDDSGAVVEVIHGSAAGISTRHSQLWDWNSRGVRGTGLIFGAAVAVADFGKNPAAHAYDDLAASDPQVKTGKYSYGAVSLLYGSESGLTSDRDQRWTAEALHRPEQRFFAESALGGS
jgi:hypothetical protein